MTRYSSGDKLSQRKEKKKINAVDKVLATITPAYDGTRIDTRELAMRRRALINFATRAPYEEHVNSRGIAIDWYGDDDKRREKRTKPLSDINRAFADWISAFQHAGWLAFFGTVLFKKLPGGRRSWQNQSEAEIEHFYSALLNAMLYQADRLKLDQLPLLIAVPEAAFRAVTNKLRLIDVRPNEGEHYHYVLIIPPWVRSRAKPFLPFFHRNYDHFVKPRSMINRVHMAAMDEQWGTVWSYMIKTSWADPDASDNYLVLPQTVNQYRSDRLSRLDRNLFAAGR